MHDTAVPEQYPGIPVNPGLVADNQGPVDAVQRRWHRLVNGKSDLVPPPFREKAELVQQRLGLL